MTPEQEQKIFTRFGYICKSLENIDKKLTILNGTTADNAKVIQKHEVFIGKIGVVMATMTFFASIVFAAIINFAFKGWK